MELFLTLVDKSLVVSEAEEGGFRYRMLEPLRQYAQEKLEESEEAQATKRAHAEYSWPWPKKPSRGCGSQGIRRGSADWKESTTTSGQLSPGP